MVLVRAAQMDRLVKTAEVPVIQKKSGIRIRDIPMANTMTVIILAWKKP
jgi:hypothetical protein